jgi:hypothetical protein
VHRLIPLTALALSTASFAAETASQPREVAPFHALAVSGGFKVTLVPGPTALTLRGPVDQFVHVITEVKDGTLHVRWADTASRGLRLRRSSKGISLDLGRNDDVDVQLSAPVIDRIALSGGVELKGETPARDRLELSTSGGTALTLSGVVAERVVLDASGGSRLSFSGATKALTADLSGGVECDASKLVAAAVTIDLSGGTEVTVHAAESLKARAAGSSELKVLGNPATRDVKTSGSASVEY